MNEEELQQLHTNQRLLVKELQSRGIKVTRLDDHIELLEAKLNDHHEFLLDRFTSLIPHTLTLLSRDKYVAKHLLKRNELNVPTGKLFDQNQIPEALKYAEQIGFPVITKPNWGSHGDGVYMNLSNKDELKSAIQNLHDELGENMPFLVEEQFTGEEYRIFITKNGDIAIVHRDPAHVIGDGIHTVQELAETESHHRMNPRTTCLCPIAIDSTVKHFLLTQGKTLTMIPKKTEKFYLRTNSNVAKGATCNDATEEAHPSVIEIAKKALKSLRGLPYAGIDLMTKDITKPQTETSYTIIEINPNPGFTMHMKPGKGTPRNVASFVADLIFPETKN